MCIRIKFSAVWEMGELLHKARFQIEGSLSLPPEYK
jgi:hypothetical protein